MLESKAKAHDNLTMTNRKTGVYIEVMGDNEKHLETIIRE